MIAGALGTLVAATVVVHVSIAALLLIVNASRNLERRAIRPESDDRLLRELGRYE